MALPVTWHDEAAVAALTSALLHGEAAPQLPGYRLLGVIDLRLACRHIMDAMHVRDAMDGQVVSNYWVRADCRRLFTATEEVLYRLRRLSWQNDVIKLRPVLDIQAAGVDTTTNLMRNRIPIALYATADDATSDDHAVYVAAMDVMVQRVRDAIYGAITMMEGLCGKRASWSRPLQQVFTEDMQALCNATRKQRSA